MGLTWVLVQGVICAWCRVWKAGTHHNVFTKFCSPEWLLSAEEGGSETTKTTFLN